SYRRPAGRVVTGSRTARPERTQLMSIGTNNETFVLESARDGQRILVGLQGDAADAVDMLITGYLDLRDRVKELQDGLPQHHTDHELCDACRVLERLCPYHTGRADGWVELSRAVRLVAGDESTYATLVLETADANGDEA
ncbi:hypothetical protein ACFWP7_31735, partial [Streptomyces sp. NPDC058470]|uniref:hypothetical protein n=1 Tax=Streptomyces sp. NPDC058470 TaxID=3346515 RepID=UPI00364610C9